MNKPYKLLVLLGLAAASLSSCSRANYAITTTIPTSELVQDTSSPAAIAASSTATIMASMPAEVVAPAREAATALAHRAAPAQAQSNIPVATANAEAEAPKVAITKTERRALRQELKRQVAAAPKQVSADGKSQTTALILCILLGGIGVHQFYLGYTGRGILRIALALTAFLIVPAIVNLVLYILDIIKIANGTLKPRNGEYAKTFNK